MGQAPDKDMDCLPPKVHFRRFVELNVERTDESVARVGVDIGGKLVVAFGGEV